MHRTASRRARARVCGDNRSVNVALAHTRHADRERLAAALRARGLQVFSVPDLKGVLDAAGQARLTIALVEPKLLQKEERDLRAQVQERAGYPIQVVALTNRVGDDPAIFDRHGATILEHPPAAMAENADWIADMVDRLTTSGRGRASGSHWTAAPEAQSAKPRAGVVLRADGPGPTILVVEDEPTFRLFLCEALGELGYRVWAASNGEDALAFFAGQDADLVISDINMPGMDGFELKQKIDLWRKKPTAFLMMTADSNAENASNASAVGVVFIIGKPLRNLESFYAIVREALRKNGVDWEPAR